MQVKQTPFEANYGNILQRIEEGLRLKYIWINNR